jgi:hypothetical protein
LSLKIGLAKKRRSKGSKSPAIGEDPIQEGEEDGEGEAEVDEGPVEQVKEVEEETRSLSLEIRTALALVISQYVHMLRQAHTQNGTPSSGTAQQYTQPLASTGLYEDR